MHYYQFNIADYRKDTQHLTPMEHYIYRSLLDWMYLDESPIPKDMRQILRRLCLSSDSSTDVEQVLNDFFTENEGGYIQERVLFEISEYKRKIESASKAGKASAKARKLKRSKVSERTFNDRSTTVQPTNNYKPITNSKTNIPTPGREPPLAVVGSTTFSRPSIDDVRGAMLLAGFTNLDPELFVAHYDSLGWKTATGAPIEDWRSRVVVWAKEQAKRQSKENANAANRPGGHSGQNRQSKSDAIREATFSNDW